MSQRKRREYYELFVIESSDDCYLEYIHAIVKPQTFALNIIM